MDLKKALYYIPGVGLATHTVKEYNIRKGKAPWYNLKKPEDRKAIKIYALETGYLIFAILWKAYIGKGIVTGNWHPFRFNSKYKIEQVQDISKRSKRPEKQNDLEKTVHYEELLK